MTEEKNKPCPICKLAEGRIVERGFDYSERVTINCPRCKIFTITRTAERMAEIRELGPKLSAWIRNRNEEAAEIPEINSKSLEEIQTGLPNYSPREKQIKLLQNIERMTKYPGKPVKIDPEFDIPLAWASAEEEFMYYINSLIERGLLRNLGKSDLQYHRDEMGGVIYERPKAFFVGISADGWDFLEQHDRRIEERTQAFVAMSFSEVLKSIWEGPIFKAIKKPVINLIVSTQNHIAIELMLKLFQK